MHEFDTVSVSSFEAPSLAAKLTERSAEGWDVVAIVPAGSDVTAFLRRESSAAGHDAEPAAATSADVAATAVLTPEPAQSSVSEPAGWGDAPAATPAASDTGWGGSSAATGADASSGWAAGSSGSSWAGQDTAATTPSTPAPAPTPSVPPGWYADPSGRYELRYWDGSAWTEHVARAGQQYTDPPVA